MTRYLFHFDTRYRKPLALVGINPHTAYVDVDDEKIRARFGYLRVSTPLSNVKCICLTGPYSAIKAIGTRGSFADWGLTMGSSTRGGVCLAFTEPIKGLDPTGKLRHPGLTLTLENPEWFATDVRKRAGLSTEIEDLRRN